MTEETNESKQSSQGQKEQSPGTVAKLKEVASDAKAAAGGAIDSGKAYAKAAVDATGRKISSANSYLSDTCDAVADAIHREPVKAVLVASAFTAALTAFVIAAVQNTQRRY